LLTGDGLGQITVRVAEYSEADDQLRLFEEEGPLRATLAIRFDGASHPLARRFPALPATEEGVIDPNIELRYRRRMPQPAEESPPAQLITPDSLEPSSMGRMWNKILIEGREAEVVAALQILEPTLNNIFFLSSDFAYRAGDRAGILAEFRGIRQRVPLGSHGDGMRRLLALSLSLIRAEGGVLLVDEIDTGLHYSIMGDMWRMVVEAAKRAKVQVFATTHSLDCVRGLGWLCETHPDLRNEVSLQKIEPALGEAVAMDPEHIMTAVQQGIEVR
jgi:hypothetical protein